jgi:hypothetical protein
VVSTGHFSAEAAETRQRAEVAAAFRCAEELLALLAALAAAHLCVAAAAAPNAAAACDALKSFGALCNAVAALRGRGGSEASPGGAGSGSSEAAAARARLAGPVWACLLAERHRPAVLAALAPSQRLPLPPATAAGVPHRRRFAASAPAALAWPLLSHWLSAATDLRARLGPRIAARLDQPHNAHASADPTAVAATAAIMATLGKKSEAAVSAAAAATARAALIAESNAGPVDSAAASATASAALLRGLPRLTALALELLGADATATDGEAQRTASSSRTGEGPAAATAATAADEAAPEAAREAHAAALLVRASLQLPPSDSRGVASTAAALAALRNLDAAVADARALAAASADLRTCDWSPAFGRVAHVGFALVAALVAAAAAPPPAAPTATARFAHTAAAAAHPARSLAVNVLLPRYLVPMLNAAAADFWAAVASAALPRADAAATAASDSSSNSSSGGGNGASALPGAGVAELCALSPAGPGSSSGGAQAGDLAVRRLLLLRGLGFSAGPAGCSAGAGSGGLLASLVALLAQLNFGRGDAKAQLDFLLNAAVAERAAAESARVALLDKGLPTLGLFHALAGAVSSADAAATNTRNINTPISSPAARPRVRLLCQCARALLAARLTALTHSTQALSGDLRAIEAAALRSLIADFDAALAL